jgi:hypothetical protein
MKNEDATKQNEKWLKVTYRFDGSFVLYSESVTAFDLWAIAHFLQLRGDELYVLGVQKKAQAEKKLDLAIARVVPKS